MKIGKLLSTFSIASVILFGLGLIEVEASDGNVNHTTIANNLTSDKIHAYGQAVLLYEKALSFEPNATDILTNKGLLLIQLQRYDEAIDTFDKILSIDSNNVDALYNKGVALEKNGMADESAIYQDKALKLDPNYSPEPINRVSTSIAQSLGPPAV